MPPRIDQTRIDEILGGDPLLLPSEAAAKLRVSEEMLARYARAGRVPSIRVAALGDRRYRTSVITRLAEDGIPAAGGP